MNSSLRKSSTVQTFSAILASTRLENGATLARNRYCCGLRTFRFDQEGLNTSSRLFGPLPGPFKNDENARDIRSFYSPCHQLPPKTLNLTKPSCFYNESWPRSPKTGAKRYFLRGPKKAAKRLSRGPQDERPPRGLHEAPERPPRGPQEAPKRPPRGCQEASKRLPRGFQEASKRLPRSFQQAPKMPPRMEQIR